MRHLLRFNKLPTVTLWAAGTLSALLSACGGGYGGGGSMGGGGGTTPCGGIYAPCPAPTVALSAPAANATVSGSVALTATATASAANGLTVARVDFMIDGTMVGTAMSSPYTVMWMSTTVTNGNHALTAKVTDSAGGTATTAAETLNVQNMAAMSATMTPMQVFPAPPSGATGMAHVTVKLASGATSGKVQLSGLTATAVTINEGFAGSTGAALLALTPSGTAGEWAVPANALLSPEQVTALTQGKLYVIARSAANPRGEVRGQLAPHNIVVSFSQLAPSEQAAGLGVAAAGVAAATLDTGTHTLTVHVNSAGVDDAQAAQASGAEARLELTKDPVNMGHWSVELAPISAADVAAVEAGRWQVSVATAVAPSGALRGALSARDTR